MAHRDVLQHPELRGRQGVEAGCVLAAGLERVARPPGDLVASLDAGEWIAEDARAPVVLALAPDGSG